MAGKIFPPPSQGCDPADLDRWCEDTREKYEHPLIEQYRKRHGKSPEDAELLANEDLALIFNQARDGRLRARFVRKGSGAKRLRRWILGLPGKRACQCYPPPIGRPIGEILDKWKPLFLSCCGSVLDGLFSDHGYGPGQAQEYADHSAISICKACAGTEVSDKVLSPKSRFLRTIEEVANDVASKPDHLSPEIPFINIEPGIWPVPHGNPTPKELNNWVSNLNVAKRQSVYGYLKGNYRIEDHLIEDFTQELWFKVSVEAPKSSFDTPESFFGWMWTVLDHLVIDHFRRRTNQQVTRSFQDAKDERRHESGAFARTDPFLTPAQLVLAHDSLKTFKKQLTGRFPEFWRRFEVKYRSRAEWVFARLCERCDEELEMTLLKRSVVDDLSEMSATLLAGLINFVAKRSDSGKANCRQAVYKVLAWIHQEKLLPDVLNKGQFVDKLIETRRKDIIKETKRKYKELHKELHQEMAEDEGVLEPVFDAYRSNLRQADLGWDREGPPFQELNGAIDRQLVRVLEDVLQNQLRSILS